MKAELEQRLLDNEAFEEGERQGHIQGEIQGEKRGKKQAGLEHATRLKQCGKLTEKEIADIIGLSLEEVQVLQ